MLRKHLNCERLLEEPNNKKNAKGQKKIQQPKKIKKIAKSQKNAFSLTGFWFPVPTQHGHATVRA